MRRILGLFFLSSAILSSAIGLVACEFGDQTAAPVAPPPPPAVGVAPVVEREITPQMEFVGRVEAIDAVDLIARVNGFLTERTFAEGAMVKAGDLLFRIEPEPFEANVVARRADVERTTATLTNARLQRERLEPLIERGGATRAQLDAAVAAEQEARAARDSAQAALQRAEIELSYTEIHAPFDGRIGRVAFPVGAVVGPTSGPLARLVRIDPVFVNIPVNDRTMLAVRRMEDSDEQFLPYVRLADGSMLEEPGRFEFFDPEVDQTTDTVRVRASFDNASEVLLPGQFVTLVAKSAEPEMAIVVPQIAVQQDQAGRLVLVVNAENQVELARVELGARVDTDWVITSGLQLGQQVIVEGVQKARPGMRVQPSPATLYEED
ncbi:MAG: efflux transporter periplasmic adaptor subunit [Halochromatium sp.]|nr:efflux transporter periplasmic adaptor subunit [Halochromatium sp.]